MRISQLDGRRVALWGWGRETRAAWRAIRSGLPRLPLTLLCSPGEAAEAIALGDHLLRVDTDAVAERLGGFDFVLKSPGISAYAPEAVAARATGTRFVGGTGLWFGERAGQGEIARGTLCITGTKGKSTTTALAAHLLRSGGHVTALAGNIGLPLLELLDPPMPPEFWAIELSSFQTRDVAISGVRPDVSVVLNLYPEHLDWHGGQQRYFDDKLALLTQARPRVAVLNASDSQLQGLHLPDSEVRWFGNRDGWHVRGTQVFSADTAALDGADLPLPGAHNLANLCAALTAIEALGLDALALAPHAAGFIPLPHRLQPLGIRDGIAYINDSISTTPHASIAALEHFSGAPVAIIVGGHDRGVDWTAFAQHVLHHPPAAVICTGQNGARIQALLSALPDRAFQLQRAERLDEAVPLARRALQQSGVVLLSPGAPSFGAYRDYVERGRHFAALAGVAPDAITAISGLGIA